MHMHCLFGWRPLHAQTVLHTPQVRQGIAAERIRALKAGKLQWSKQTANQQQQRQQEQLDSIKSSGNAQAGTGIKQAVRSQAQTPWAQLPPEERDQKMAAASARYKALAAIMTPEQREREER